MPIFSVKLENQASWWILHCGILSITFKIKIHSDCKVKLQVLQRCRNWWAEIQCWRTAQIDESRICSEGAPGCPSRLSLWLLVSMQVIISWVVRWSPKWNSMLNGESAWGFRPATPPHSHSLSLKYISKIF